MIFGASVGNPRNGAEGIDPDLERLQSLERVSPQFPPIVKIEPSRTLSALSNMLKRLAITRL